MNNKCLWHEVAKYMGEILDKRLPIEDGTKWIDYVPEAVKLDLQVTHNIRWGKCGEKIFVSSAYYPGEAARVGCCGTLEFAPTRKCSD